VEQLGESGKPASAPAEPPVPALPPVPVLASEQALPVTHVCFVEQQKAGAQSTFVLHS